MPPALSGILIARAARRVYQDHPSSAGGISTAGSTRAAPKVLHQCAALRIAETILSAAETASAIADSAAYRAVRQAGQSEPCSGAKAGRRRHHEGR
jgi:hypothetical protein